MLQYQINSKGVIDATKLVSHVTIVGKLVPISNEDYMKLVRLAHDFRKAVTYATRMIAKKHPTNNILRELRAVLNKAYGDSAYKIAKTLVEGAKFNGSSPRRIKVRKLFIISEGEASRFGNRNVRLEDIDMAKIRYPYNGTWLNFKVLFGTKHIPLVKELVELAKARKVSYGARIVFRNGSIYLHLSIPVHLYLKYFKKRYANGKLVAGFDLNSDRINMVIVDRYGRIKDTKTAWFPEITSHGFPKNKAKAKRLEALAKLLKYAYYHDVGTVVFENLLMIKHRKYTRSPTANRKISRFAKKELLQHAIISAMKYGFKILLVNPRGTTRSKEHDKAMRKYGLDRHTASAYLIAVKSIEGRTMIQKTIT